MVYWDKRNINYYLGVMLCTSGSCDHIHSVSAVTATYFRCFPSSWKPGRCFKMDI